VLERGYITAILNPGRYVVMVMELSEMARFVGNRLGDSFVGERHLGKVFHHIITEFSRSTHHE
jgi:hypothetical protein